ncbi:MAG TPA: SagB/ThcOx family dehydrogenase, partial [Vicinamibacteria bacterium]|nr:SagB/ThcOx family dehydrogenase [Vicinamibacteria bacterium]
MLAALEAVFAYHERTKHRPLRYAASPGHLDWANEPDPFRRYAGAPAVELPLAADGLDAAYGDLHRPGALAARPLGLTTIGAFFELALGLSAWKQFRGARWALRCNPSSGNLHPTEAYALLPEAPGLPAGLHHYLSLDHALERRSSLSERSASRLRQVLPPGGFLAGLATIHWREAWKYGERAFRYCAHDTGHALAALRYAAAALGWSARLVTGVADADVAAILGLDRDADFAHLAAQDREDPEALLLVTTGGGDAEEAAERLEDAADEVVDLVRGGAWAGRANAL